LLPVRCGYGLNQADLLSRFSQNDSTVRFLAMTSLKWS